MVLKLSSRLQAVAYPPIAEAFSWVDGRTSTRELLNLCQAVPSYPPAPGLQQEFARLAALPGTGGYTEIFGVAELREGFAAHISADYGASIGPECVAMTTGCNQAFAASLMAMADPGDNIIMPAPYYFNHNMWCGMMGIEVKAISAFSDEGNWPSVDAARAAITPRTKAIMLCSPNNPTGAIYPPQVLHAFYELAREADIFLIIDETYKDFRPDPAPPHNLLNQDGAQDHLVQLFSFSKIYALAGYRLGAMIAGPSLLHEAAKILDTMTICPPQITQRGVIFALRELDTWKAEKKQLMAGRLAALRSVFAAPELKYELASSGAYFAYVRHPFKGKKSKDVAKWLVHEHDVLCLPGSMFGPDQEDYLRLAFANVDAEKMPLLLDRLISAISFSAMGA